MVTGWHAQSPAMGVSKYPLQITPLGSSSPVSLSLIGGAAAYLRFTVPAGSSALCLGARFGGRLLDEHLVIGEDGRALLHFAFAAAGGPLPTEAELHAAVAVVVRSWREALRDVLVGRHGEGEGGRLAARWF